MNTVLGLSVLVLCVLAAGCLGRLDRLDTRLTGIESTVTGIETGDIGGGSSDSVTTWIREVGFWVVGAGLYYPVVHRPARKWWQNGKAKA